MYTFNNLKSNSMYTVWVAAINCAGDKNTTMAAKTSEWLDTSNNSEWYIMLRHVHSKFIFKANNINT